MNNKFANSAEIAATRDADRAEPRAAMRLLELPGSIYVLLGYLLWFGFYLGALLLHSLHR